MLCCFLPLDYSYFAIIQAANVGDGSVFFVYFFTDVAVSTVKNCKGNKEM